MRVHRAGRELADSSLESAWTGVRVWFDGAPQEEDTSGGHWESSVSGSRPRSCRQSREEPQTMHGRGRKRNTGVQANAGSANFSKSETSRWRCTTDSNGEGIRGGNGHPISAPGQRLAVWPAGRRVWVCGCTCPSAAGGGSFCPFLSLRYALASAWAVRSSRGTSLPWSIASTLPPLCLHRLPFRRHQV